MPILDLDLSGLSPLDLTQDSQDSQELDLSGIKPINIRGKDVKIPSVPVSSIAAPKKKEVNLDLSGVDLDLSDLEPIDISSQTPKVSESDLTNDENFSETFKDKATTSTPIQTDFNIATTLSPIKFEEADPIDDINLPARIALGSGKAADVLLKTSLGPGGYLLTKDKPDSNIKLTKPDPDILGKPISFTVNTREAIDNGRILSTNDFTDAFLESISPAAKAANIKYRSETGRNLLEPVKLKFDEVTEGSLKVTARPEKSAIDILNAYMRGGLLEARKEGERIAKERLDRDAEFSQLDTVMAEYEKKHPYITAAYAGTKGGIVQTANLLQNLYAIEEANAIGGQYGYDSKEYRDLILNEAKQRGFINQASKETPTVNKLQLVPEEVETILATRAPILYGGLLAAEYSPKIVEDVAQFAVSYPTYELAGFLGGPFGLPTLVYLENINNGNMPAALAALPMALAMGSVSGINKAIAGSGDLLTPSGEGYAARYRTKVPTEFVKTTPEEIDTFSDALYGENFIENLAYKSFDVIENRLPIRDKSLFNLERQGVETFKVSSPFLGSEIPVESISPLARQLILRGTQGGIFGGATYLETRNPEEAFHAFVTGLFLPVGGDSRRSSISTIGDIVDSQTGEVIKTIPRLGAADIKFEIPLEKTQVLQFSTEKPLRDIGEGVIANETEKGFEAQTTPATFRQNLDSAALNYLELKRALENQEWKAPNISLAEAARRQKALAEAVGVYEKAIPEEYREWFKKNESVVRAAQREGNRELLDKVNQIREGKKRQEQTSPTPNKESIIRKSTNAPKGEKGFSSIDFMQQALENYGDVGIKNKYISQESALRESKNIGKAPTTNQLSEGLTSIPKWMASQTKSLTILSAFHIEDFYRRGIQPTIEAFTERLKADLGELITKIPTEQIQRIFDAGMKFYEIRKNQRVDEFVDKFNRDKKRVRVEQDIDGNYKVAQYDKDFENKEYFAGYLDDRNFGTREMAEKAADKAWNTYFVNASQYEPANSGIDRVGDLTQGITQKRLITRDVFNPAKEEVVSSITKISTTGDERGIVLNSGLNPQEFVEQARLLYKGIKDFGTFTSEMIAQFGEKVKPYLEPIWNYIKDLGTAFNEGFNQFKEDVSKASESEAFENRESERGFLGLGNAPKVLDYVTSPELRKLNFEKLTNSPKALALEFMRDTGLAQLFPAYGEVFNTFRDVEGMLNSRASNIVKIMDDVRTFTSATEQENVSNVLYVGNVEKKTYSPTELAAGDATTGRVPLNPNEVNAYAKIREIQDNILSLRMLQKLYREYDRLANLTPGSKAFNDARAKIAKIRNHYQSLADEGYISLQRRGRYAVYGEKLTYSSTQNPAEKFYYLTDSQLDAKNRLDFARAQGFNINSDLYDTKDSHKFNILSARLTPNILEDLIISSGIDVNKTVIDSNTGNNIKVGDLLENLRNEVYANYKTTSYELNREFVPGFKTDFRTLSQTLGAQLETFSKSFYGDIGKQEAIKSLNKSGIIAPDFNYGEFSDLLKKERNGSITPIEQTKLDAWKKHDPKVAAAIRQFIADATTSEAPSFIGKAASKARSATYFMSLAFDGMQFVLNGFSQPNTNTYSYFSRLPEMKGADAEVYHIRAMKLSNLILAERLSGRDSIARSSIFSEIAKASGVSKDNVRTEFTSFYNRAKDEHIVTPEFTKSLLEGVGRKNVLESTNKIRDIGRKFRNDWATIFTTAGERVTRTHAFSEAYLIGKEKLGLSGNELYRFMRFAVDATQGHFGKASNPKFVRRGGEVGKLFYQFGSFGNLWFEGLGLAAKKDISNLRQGNFLKTANSSTVRHLLPIVLGAGLSGLPFYNGFRTTWNVMYGEDPQKEYIDKALGDRSLLRNMSLYGVTGNKAVSNRFGINVPLVDNLQYALTRDDYSILSGIPAAQLGKRFLYDAPRDILEGNYERVAEDVTPNVIRRGLVGQRYYNRGARSRNNKVLVPRRKISTTEDIIQATTGLQPSEVLEKYDENAFKGVRKVGKDIRSKLKKRTSSIYKFLQD